MDMIVLSCQGQRLDFFTKFFNMISNVHQKLLLKLILGITLVYDIFKSEK